MIKMKKNLSEVQKFSDKRIQCGQGQSGELWVFLVEFQTTKNAQGRILSPSNVS